ncbi:MULTISPECIES: D-aminoacyl-tRNA deacylase [unclassified Wenzhouxiangella]|uniref:D-aminoacyl-tRNA deacylase n=1 Tax=unclassified Wenzhouxiangella TaxID=2613841 RepID=UPI000E327573|nr:MULTISPECIES: D-aminoacyl-tRNA deacylase [unclassified Wenzhouxiangella]RFF27151.1 D-tyrosyl-tRNA(Tyr) deacylase [Wenzhouxiangella sp. 15181]RFP69162.1 D-tyrosyl-tRNA(Tyr) deacylase [Wenzhouxiangella sp. 15190]
MIGLLQRVSEASVRIDGETVGRIGPGLLVLAGFRQGDRAERIPRFIERLLNYRVFADDKGRMNVSLRDAGGGLLVVPQFTLAADTNSGNRPSFTPAAPPSEGEALFEALAEQVKRDWPNSAFGRFGADMQVALVNDGPVTFWIEVN